MTIKSIKSVTQEIIREGGLSKANKNGQVNNFKQTYRTCTDLDDIFAIIGSQGKYQKIFLYGILSPLYAIEPFLAFSIFFILYEPDHWCMVDGQEKSGLDLESWKNLTIPRDSNGDFSKCEMYADISNHSTIVTCTKGWQYDLQDYDHTIPSDYNWVCERGEWATWCLTANAVGNAIGTVVLGQAADKIGRKPVFIITLALNIFGRLASLHVANSLWMFLLLTFITALGFPMLYIVPAMIGAEFSDKDFRAWIYSWTWMLWVVGLAILPWIAYLARDWYVIGLITTVPWILAFASCNWLQESPRYLLSMGKVTKLVELLKTIAKTNGTQDRITDKELYSMLKQIIVKQEEQSDENYGVFQLFAKWRLARNTMLISVSWIVNAVIYYAITMNASNLSGNQFLNFFILAVIEIPAGYLGSVLCDKVGRRWTQVAVFVLGAGASFMAGVAVGFPMKGWQVFSVIAAVIAKFSVSLTFLVVYLQATEIFPTPLRSTGSGFASTSSSVVSIFTPYIVYLAKYGLGLPWFTITALSLVGVMSSACLPETLNQRLPETLEEAANFGKENKFWSFRPPPTNDDKVVKVNLTNDKQNSNWVWVVQQTIHVNSN